jgi:hypothetical protein
VESPIEEKLGQSFSDVEPFERSAFSLPQVFPGSASQK